MFVLSILYLLLSNTIITIDALGPLASVDVPDELLLVQLLMLLLQLPKLLLKKKLQWLLPRWLCKLTM